MASLSLQIATRKAYGMALAKLGRYNERVIALDGDTNNLTYSEIFKNEHPNRFVECYIAQQNMVCSLVSQMFFETFIFTNKDIYIYILSVNVWGALSFFLKLIKK